MNGSFPVRWNRLAPLALLACSLAATACGADTDGPADPPSATPAASDLERLDRLWADVAAAQFDLRLRESERIIDCLESEGFDVHNIESMTSTWNFTGPGPSAILASHDDPVDLPTAAEAEERALGFWLGFAHTYDDRAGIDLREAELSADEESAFDEGFVEADLSSLEPAGEGWEALPAVEQMEWEIAYRGVDWASSSKTASVLSADDWSRLGLPDGTWVPADELDTSPQGCQAQVLTGLHGEPRQVENGFAGAQWVWGPTLASAAPEPYALDAVLEAEPFLECLAAAGHEDWTLTDTGGLDYYDHWQDQYLPEAAAQHEDGTTEYRDSDVTDADRERYETVKAAEFAAAAAIASCDESTGYTEAVRTAFEQRLTQDLLAGESAQQTYLAELETALAAIDS